MEEYLQKKQSRIFAVNASIDYNGGIYHVFRIKSVVHASVKKSNK